MNKHGWGLRMELVFILIFLICLAFSTIGLNKMGLLGNQDNTGNKPTTNGSSIPNDFTYDNLENKVVNATKKYINEEYFNNLDEQTTIIKVSTLYYKGYITKLYDNNNIECSGYSEVIKINENIIYKPFIKCEDYETSGYEGKNDW